MPGQSHGDNQSNLERLLVVVLAVNTFVVLGVGFKVASYLVETEKRLTAIETKIIMLHKGGQSNG